MFKEMIKKFKDFGGKIGLSNLFKDNTRKISGELFLTLSEKGEVIKEVHMKNIIVDSASILIARLLADGQASVDPSGPNHGIWVLAVGTGAPAWDKQNPPPPTAAQTRLEAELARKRFANVNFVKTDGSGLPSTSPTNIVDFQCVFNESESVGGICELGMFGGGTGAENIEITPNSGTLLNFRTIPVINKNNTSTLSIIFRITT